MQTGWTKEVYRHRTVQKMVEIFENKANEKFLRL